MSFIYIATPYSHQDSEVRRGRYQAACKAASTVLSYQIPVYSPIVHWHSIAETENLPTAFNYFQQQNEAMLKACRELWIITIFGWNTSKGVKHERDFCIRNSKDVHYVELEDLDNYCRTLQQDLGSI